MVENKPSGHVKLPLVELTSVIIVPAVTLYNPGVLECKDIGLCFYFMIHKVRIYSNRGTRAKTKFEGAPLFKKSKYQ